MKETLIKKLKVTTKIINVSYSVNSGSCDDLQDDNTIN